MTTKIQFCCGGKKCPIVEQKENGEIHIGGKKEGITIFNKGNLTDFVKAAKAGKFDNLIK